MPIEETQTSVHTPFHLAGKGKAFGTFGELLQGRLENELDFLVTFPISCYSYATFISEREATHVQVFPDFKQKSLRMAEVILRHYTLPPGGKLIIKSDIPVGKGLASSSADLVATARAISACFGIKIPVLLLEHFAGEIEPSDGVMYQGIVSYYHRQVRLQEFLGTIPPLTVVGIDEGGQLDSIQYNQYPKPFTREDKKEYQHLLHKISVAIRDCDLQEIGNIANRSAEMNQKLNQRQHLEEVMAIKNDIEGLGVIVAHSGTCLGILLSIHHPEYTRQVQQAREALAVLNEKILLYHSVNFTGKKKEKQYAP